MSDTVKVFWAPANFTTADEQWNLLYEEPRRVLRLLASSLNEDAQMIQCPALRASLKNVFSVHSTITDEGDLTQVDQEALATPGRSETVWLDTKSRVALFSPRSPSIARHFNVNYNLGWYFFADESLEARWTAPYFPTEQPMQNALLAPGQMNIGQWFRPFNLDYHVPVGTQSFNLEEGQPLAFIQFATDKEIELVRFQMTPLLHNLSSELTSSPRRYKRNIPLSKRYEMAKKSKTLDIIRTEVQRNAIG